MDGAKEQLHGKMRKVINAHHIKVSDTVPYSPWRNKAKALIRQLKYMMRRIMRASRAPLWLWCYALTWASAIRRFSASDIPVIEGCTPMSM